MQRSSNGSVRSYVARCVSVAALFLVAACGNGTGPSDGPPAVITDLPRSLTALEQEAIRASNQFGLELMSKVADSKPGENVVLSPFSASVALGMTYAGADGTTAAAMRQTLGWGARSRGEILNAYRELPALLVALDAGVTLRSANAIWVRETLSVRPEFITDVRAAFDSEVRTGDFGPATVSDMNAWASQQTNGLIPKVVDELGNDLVMVLMNALYFKGSWREKFDVTRTRQVPFTTSSGARPSVPMMFQTEKMKYARQAGAQWAELPYGNTAYVMTVVLPDSGANARTWLRGLDVATYESGLVSMAEATVEFGLPKWRLKAEYQLKGPLVQMGMGVAFDAALANFDRISPDDLLLSYVKQDVYIDVNEEGTEAAAVTQVGISVTSAPMRPVMVLDRPFLFFIRERLGGTVLFSGLIEEPKIQ